MGEKFAKAEAFEKNAELREAATLPEIRTFCDRSTLPDEASHFLDIPLQIS
jgi:hypothetical protein